MHCFDKCVRRVGPRVAPQSKEDAFADMGELSIKECACVDRCVQKFIQSQELAGRRNVQFARENKAASRGLV